MPSADPVMAQGATLEALQSRPSVNRRPRPPTLHLSAPDESRVPLRNEKLNRRESRLGLRNIFGRSKAQKEEGPMSPSALPRGAVRVSVADMDDWSYVPEPLQSPSTISPDDSSSSRPLSIALESPGPGQFAHQTPGIVPKRKVPPISRSAHPPRDTLARWDQPPLFKAYPQAIRHGTLPATSMSADAIVRWHEKNEKNEKGGETTGEPAEAEGKEKEKWKRKRRNASLSTIKLDWTTKIFILVTSGYLLQYASEGPFDRLPEKVLHLGKNSAAFASDIIPGRHWVLQVSAAAAAEPDTSSVTESRSLFSRLTFRPAVTERRQTSNVLLVFENAEDMEGWMATLRREIEKLGGKKKLSETGKPKVEDDSAHLRERPSQRTLVVRDPDRYSTSVPNDLPWHSAIDLTPETDSSITITDPDMTPDPSLDDISTTNSVISHDGRQLDALRDSANRLSFISSGQRTIITSAGSSPACSPILDSFPSTVDDLRPSLEARPRPNASSIVDRRKSLQTMSPFVGVNEAPSPAPRRQSAFIAPRAESAASPAPGAYAPNFSVPHSSNRRFSYVKTTPELETPSPQPRENGDSFLRVAPRKNPPTSLRLARPLSMVADQPSPREDVPERPATRHGETRASLSSQARPPPQPRFVSRNRVPTAHNLASRRSSLFHSDVSAPPPRTSPRRLASTGTLRGPSEAPRLRNLMVQGRLPESSGPHSWTDSERAHSSLGMRSRSPPPPPHVLKRASMAPMFPERILRAMSVPSIAEALPPPSGPLPPLPGTRPRGNSRGSLYSRRSMPQLVNGPPPAPPPTCALPPIPQKMSLQGGGPGFL